MVGSKKEKEDIFVQPFYATEEPFFGRGNGSKVEKKVKKHKKVEEGTTDEQIEKLEREITVLEKVEKIKKLKVSLKELKIKQKRPVPPVIIRGIFIVGGGGMLLLSSFFSDLTSAGLAIGGVFMIVMGFGSNKKENRGDKVA